MFVADRNLAEKVGEEKATTRRGPENPYFGNRKKRLGISSRQQGCRFADTKRAIPGINLIGGNGVALDDQSLQLALAWMEQMGPSKFIWTYWTFSDPVLCAFADHCVFSGIYTNIKIGAF